MSIHVSVCCKMLGLVCNCKGLIWTVKIWLVLIDYLFSDVTTFIWEIIAQFLKQLTCKDTEIELILEVLHVKSHLYWYLIRDQSNFISSAFSALHITSLSNSPNNSKDQMWLLESSNYIKINLLLLTKTAFDLIKGSWTSAIYFMFKIQLDDWKIKEDRFCIQEFCSTWFLAFFHCVSVHFLSTTLGRKLKLHVTINGSLQL